MEFVCVKSRFHFFDGSISYTVQYNYGICMWFVFKEETNSDALWSKRINPKRNKTPNRLIAEDVLNQYLESINEPETSNHGS